MKTGIDKVSEKSSSVLLHALPEDDVPKVIAQAISLQEDALAKSQETKALSDTVTELKVSEEYLGQAIEAYRHRKQQSHRRRVLGTAGALVVLSGASAFSYFATRPVPPVHYAENFDSAPETRWLSRTNPQSTGSLNFVAQADGHQLVASLNMPQTQRDEQGHWYGRIESEMKPPRLTGDHLARFSLNGSTVKVRMIFENDTDRWVSPVVPTTGAAPFDTVTLRLKEFSHQVRTPSGSWRPGQPAPIDNVDRIAFEANDQDNPTMKDGGFAIDDVDIQ